MNLNNLYIHALHERSNVYWLNADYKSFLNDINIGRKEASKIKSIKDIAAFELQKADYLFMKGKYKKSLEMYNELYNKFRKIEEMKFAARCLSNAGFSQSRLGNLREELRYYKRAMRLYDAEGDVSGKAYCLNNISAYYYKTGDYDKQYEYVKSAIDKFRSIKHKMGEALCLNNIGAYYNKVGDIDNQIKYFSASLKIREEIGYKQGISLLHNNIGTVYSKTGNISKYVSHIKKAITSFRQSKNLWGLALSYNSAGHVLLQSGHIESAEAFLKKSYSICIDINDINRSVSVLQNLCSLYFEKKNIKMLKKYLSAMQKTVKEKVATRENELKLAYCNVLKEILLSKEEAVQSLQLLIKKSESFKSAELTGKVYLITAEFYANRDDFKKSEKYFEKSVEIFERSGNQLLLNQVYRHYWAMYENSKDIIKPGELRKKIEGFNKNIVDNEEIAILLKIQEAL